MAEVEGDRVSKWDIAQERGVSGHAVENTAWIVCIGHLLPSRSRHHRLFVPHQVFGQLAFHRVSPLAGDSDHVLVVAGVRCGEAELLASPVEEEGAHLRGHLMSSITATGHRLVLWEAEEASITAHVLVGQVGEALTREWGLF
jgi:hypothetical protein